MMESNPHRSRFRERDVVLFLKLHADTAKLQCEASSGNDLYEVEGKRRPMIVYGIERKNRYITFALTTQNPRNPSRYLKDSNGKPMLLHKEHGIKKPSYLQLMPQETAVDHGDCKRVSLFPSELFEHAVRELARMLMGDTR